MADISLQVRLLQEQLQQERQRAQQAEGRAKQAEGRAEQAESRAEQERQRAEQERRRTEEEKKQTRRTTFVELLEACHRLSESMSVQSDKSLSTQGSMTSPKGKRCPTTLRPWNDFPNIQQSVFDVVYDTLHPPNDISPRLFSPLLYIEELGRTMPGRKIASEEDLKLFQHSTVENFVADIVSAVATNHQRGEDLALGKGVVFENHSNTLSDMAEDVQSRLQLSTSSSNPYRPPKPIHADQICVLKTEDGQMDLLFIIEYKAPHKLTKEVLRAGLRTMDVPKEVIHRPTIPTDPYEKFIYNADRLVAAAATQTYSYMLESGTEYSCIITGEAMVFLWIDVDDSNTLFYHLAEPNEEVYAGDGLGFTHPLTAIGQLLSFCLIALRSGRRDQLWRDTSIEKAYTWSDDWGKILRNIPRQERKLDPPPSNFKARRYPLNVRSPYYLRKKGPKSYRSSCSPEIDLTGDDWNDPPDGSGGGPESIHTPSKRGSTSGSRGGYRGRGAHGSSSVGNQRQYCTQGCLLGLVGGSALDKDCPNINLHSRGEKLRTHLLTKQQFSVLVQQQLAATLDRNCTELKKQGTRGALFKITLASYGYTFVGKGTRDVFVPDLKHEGRMYDRLQSIQGKMIPVYLGNINLDRPWRDLGVRIIHMLLMSWGGERVDKVKGARSFKMDIKQFEGEIAQLGVQHEDLILDNMLWNEEADGMMFIDLERATEIRRTALQELPVNRKRKRSFPDVKLYFGTKAEASGETEAVLEKAKDGSGNLAGALY